MKEVARTVLPVSTVRGLIYSALPKAAMQIALIHKWYVYNCKELMHKWHARDNLSDVGRVG